MNPCRGLAPRTVAPAVSQRETPWGFPLPKNQVVGAPVWGPGAPRRFTAVRWGVARRIVWAWVFTIPASATLAALAALVIRSDSLALVLAILVLAAASVWLARWKRAGQPTTDLGS